MSDKVEYRLLDEETWKRCLILAEDPRNEYEETQEIVRRLKEDLRTPAETVSREPIALDVLRKTYSDASNRYFYEHQHDGMSKTEMHDARFDAGMLAVYDLQLPATRPVSTGEVVKDAFEAGFDAGFLNAEDGGPIMEHAVERYLAAASRPPVPATTDPRDVVLPWAELMDLIAYFNTFGDDKAEAMLRGLKPVQAPVSVPMVVKRYDMEVFSGDAAMLEDEFGQCVLYDDIAHLLTSQPSSQPDLSKVVETLELAQKEVERLCSGERWKMSIPANESKDSDIIISTAITKALAALRNGGVR